MITTTQFDSTFKSEEILKRKRYLIIAHLPTVSICNKTPITNEERIDAERFAIRYFAQVFHENTWKCPSLYRKLTEKHGVLEQVAEVDMRIVNVVEIFIEFVEDGVVIKKIPFSLDLSQSFDKLQVEVVQMWNGNVDIQ